ncbi:LOW QUALITY PROTEIN: von Willebrand factor A domain-containing protein 7-like [Salminus brasiliensis]|uniref:LOW QUALITY PROTEIN: von Willebrand factor A domain-containing protein 7-like n=1 Tax=Salminus brasiliensis TaxID=930266 RepID=UPI003B83792A
MASSGFDPGCCHIYQDLAQASGGQVVEVTKATLPQATNPITMTAGLLIRTSSLFLLVFLTHRQTLAFLPRSFGFSSSKTHKIITHDAILETTAEVCRAQALREGRDFVLPSKLTVESLTAACSSPDSAKGFQKSINKIVGSNAWVDFRHFFKPEYHFDDEAFFSGRALITTGVRIVKNSIKQQSYEAAREKLGEVLHTLQDFYSHSNWIELRNDAPYSNLIKPSSPIENTADPSTPTCRSCSGNDCSGNLLEEIITQKKLTSGYFAQRFFKPKGKCSHGGLLDLTRFTEPTGGINKDSKSSEHGDKHEDAAKVATAATRELLEDIRAAVGDFEFLRLMGFTQASVLCFVIDTTGSMSDDIAEVRRVTSFIINSRKGTAKQPSEYILVPFNDPDFGPLKRTTDPDLFKSEINALIPNDGGDIPEMCLSGLQLALTGSPPETEIFVFTDADKKDKALKSTILALIERTKSAVSFMLTNALGARRRRRNSPQDDQQQVSSRLSNPMNEVYLELAQASGGQAIEVTKATLPQATSIIVESSSASVVTVFQAVRDPGKAETFSFYVDSSLQNLTIYITGNSPDYTITSPSAAEIGEILHMATGTLEEIASDQFMVTINMMPAGEFVVRVTGVNSSSRASDGLFQRQSSTQLRSSSVTVTAQADETLEPGRTLTLPFTVATNGSGGIFNIRVSNDRSFLMTDAPSTLTLETGGSANGTVTLAAPGNTPSGTDVTVTIEAEAPGGTDSNYAVLRLSVVAPVTDITPPVCEIVSVNANCSGNCSLSSWDLSANMTDRNGSGIQSVSVRQGTGSLNTSTVLDGGVNVTVVLYTASCCFPQVELVVVDSVGNVGSCGRSLIADVSASTSPTSTNTAANTTTATVGTTVQTSTNGAERSRSLPVFFWLTVGTASLYQLMQL